MERILIFGNTHESREAAQTMRRRGKQVIVCVTTEYARAQLPPGTMCHIGRFDDGQMLSYIRQTNPRKVIDATHPYATATRRTHTPPRRRRASAVPPSSWAFPASA